MPSLKSKLRAEIAGALKALPADYCRTTDAAICRAVIDSTAWRAARTVFCYVGTAREIDTGEILRAALREGKVLAVPLCTGSGVMEARRIQGMDDLVSGKYGILAPWPHCPLVEPGEFDLCIIPCSTGNAKGRRLGYGGGYYDRYLPKTSCPTMLLCRGKLVREDIPTEDHDLTMTYFVTEDGVAVCGESGQ